MLRYFLKLAELSYESKDYKAAVESCNKILTIDSENYKAWEVKAKSIGWCDSTLANPKCFEALEMAKKAIQFATPEAKQTLAGTLQTEICLQTFALIDLYSSMNSMGRVMNQTTFVMLMNTYLQALELPYVLSSILNLNCDIIAKKLTPNETFAQICFLENVKGIQKELNQGKDYLDEVEKIREYGNNNNEINYWKDYPEFLNSNKEKILAELKEELNKWQSIEEKYCAIESEIAKTKEIVKQNQFKLFGEGAKIRRENEEKIYSLQTQKFNLESEYKERQKSASSIEKKIELLNSI